MYNQSKLSELIQFARIDAGSIVIDVYPGDGDWTRLFSDIVGPEGRVYSFVPAEIAHVKNDSVGRMRTLAKEPGRENVEVVSADLVVLPRSPHRADPGQGRNGGPLQSSCLRAAEARWVLRHRRPRRRRRGGHERRPVAASD
jgi:predicted methyltransferase